MIRVSAEEFIGALAKKGIEADAFPEGVRLVEDLPYSHVGGRDLPLDLYDLQAIPAAPRPAMLFVHGGGWKRGDKKQFWGQAAYLALRHGVLGVCVNYRLSPEAPFPAAIQDVKCAVRWLRSNATEFRLDPERIGIAGGSAGGHLAALAATTGNVLEYDGIGGHQGFSSHVNLAIILNGILNLVDLGQRWGRAARNPLTDFMGGKYDDMPQTYLDASPFHRATEDTPPMLLMHGREDVTVPCRQSEAMHEKLEQLGVSSELEIYEGVEHAWFNRAPHFLVTLSRMGVFLEKHFGLVPFKSADV